MPLLLQNSPPRDAATPVEPRKLARRIYFDLIGLPPTPEQTEQFIDAFNEDMPFDQFVRWQIAGDEYEPNNPTAVIATGFLNGGTHSKLPDTFIEEERLFNGYNELDDVVSTLGTSLLGLTVGCARCHDPACYHG